MIYGLWVQGWFNRFLLVVCFVVLVVTGFFGNDLQSAKINIVMIVTLLWVFVVLDFINYKEKNKNRKLKYLGYGYLISLFTILIIECIFYLIR